MWSTSTSTIEHIDVKGRMLKVGFNASYVSEIEQAIKEAAKIQSEHRRYQLYSKLLGACDAFEDKRPLLCDAAKYPASTPPNGCTGTSDSLGNANFTPACNRHDTCYARLSAVKGDCDATLVNAVWETCLQDSGYDANACLGVRSMFSAGLANPVSAAYFAAAQNTANCQNWHLAKDAVCDAARRALSS